MSILRDLFLFHAPPPLRTAAAYLLVVMLASWLLAGRAFVVDGTIIKDGHATTSLELALVRAYCGVPSSYSGAARVVPGILQEPARFHLPLQTVIADQAGSLAEYCRQADQPFVNNENALLLIETALLRLSPGMSLSDLGQALHALRIAGLALFALAVLSLGGSVWLALGAMLCGLLTLDAMHEFIYSAYPFLFVLVLLLVSAYSLALRFGWAQRLPGALAFGAVAGILSAAVVHMRTSYLPIAAAALVMFAGARWWLAPRSSPQRREVMLSVVTMLACLGGYLSIQAVLLTRHLSADQAGRASHSVAHPLVLALGVPETPFSRELGIRWDDVVGPQIAAKVDPAATYLSPRYDDALMTYYRQLWADRPGQMLDLYRTKFAVAGSNMLEVLRSSPGSTGLTIAVLLAPLDWLTQVAWLLVVELAVAGAGLYWFIRRRTVAAFGVALLSIAAAFLQAEAGIVYSLFVQQYHNYGAFFVLFISLIGVQVIVNLVWRPGRLQAAAA